MEIAAASMVTGTSKKNGAEHEEFRTLNKDTLSYY